MSCSIGLDIGGTKIAGAAYDEEGRELSQVSLPTPNTYEAFLETCCIIVKQLDEGDHTTSIGACAPYVDANVCSNIPCLIGRNMQQDLEKLLDRSIPFSNDANCAALAEAMEGAGRGYTSVFGLIMGTGIGGGFVFKGHILGGANGLCGEIGHLPLPSYEESDGMRIRCGCGQTGCIEQFISGAALARLYHALTGKHSDAKEISSLALQGEVGAISTLDRYFTLVAKAMVVVLHSFDPDIIIVSGGLNGLPGLYDEVPKRWEKYALCKTPTTRFVPAFFGPAAGLRGAAWLGKGKASEV